MVEFETVSTSCGQVRGQKTSAGYSFLGVPYGKAERFRPPLPVTWKEPLDCLDYGPAAPQPNYRGEKPENLSFQMVGAEDCLNLNIWTKWLDKKAKQPVVVYIYGGAFQTGRNSMPECAGDLFMEEDEMVFVSINYRVGVLGFLELSGIYGKEYRGSGNCGILDQIMAIHWIQENIASFGGDPEQITLMGISAGAKSIASLITLPEIQKICHKIILESGAMQSMRTWETANQVARRYLSYLPEGTDLRTVSADILVEAQARFCACDGCTCFFGPVLIDPFHSDWQERWEDGERFQGRAIIGGGRHELVKLVQKPYFLGQAEQIAMDMFGDNGVYALQKFKELTRRSVNPQEAWESVFSDFMYRFYSTELAKKLEADGNFVWSYSFDYGSAHHGMGFAYLMKHTSINGEENEGRSVSDFMRRQIRNFILTGEPDPKLWPQYQGGYKLVLDAQPHMEYRPNDTLTGFPPQTYVLAET